MFARKSLCEADLTYAACIADMLDVAAGSLSIAFVDFKYGYLSVDREGVRALRDPYSAKPYVPRSRTGHQCDQGAEVS
jgi:hypothetical protein